MAALMMDYIDETAFVLRGLVRDHERVAAAFVEAMTGRPLGQVYIVGSGTSYHAGEAAKPYLEHLLGCRVTALYPTHFAADELLCEKDALLVGISQSGQSTSTVAALDAARRRGMMTAAISDNADALVFEHADTRVMMGAGEENSGAKTKGYACSVAALWVMFTELACATGRIDCVAAEGYYGRMVAVADNLAPVIDASRAWYGRIATELSGARRMFVVGYPPYYGDVLEGALKLLETIRQSVAGYDTEEFLHGIYNSINDECHVFYLLPAGAARERTVRLSGVLADWTGHSYRISSSKEGFEPSARDLIAPFEDDEFFSVLEYIVPLQVVACLGSQERGINPDVPKDPTFHIRMGSKRLEESQMVFGKRSCGGTD